MRAVHDEGGAELDQVDAIYDALDSGEPATALRLATAALEREADDPVLRFLAGVALLELERPDEALEELARAVAIDPEDAEFRARLAEALFRCCRFAEAEPHARHAVDADPRLALGHHLQGLLLERRGRFAEAERALARASELDPEAFPLAVRVAASAFRGHLAAAIERLPRQFREPLTRVAVGIEPLPSDELLHDESPPLDPEILGLFVGVPLTEHSVLDAGGELPPRIYLFQRNLERFAIDTADLVEQIGITLRHELGHYLGLGEDEIERAGHA